MRAELDTLNARVNDATRLAQQESAAAIASSQRAEDAAARATEAATGRKQAEQEKQLADATRTQALTEAQQATESAQRASENATRARENAQKAEDQMTQMRREREEELNHMQEALNRVVHTRRTPNGMVIVLPDSSFRFGFDSAELSEKNRELLSRIAGVLLVSKGYGLAVYGYTDDVGSAEYNQQLSMRRAKSVENYLIKAGIDSSILTAKGYGKTSPLVPGNTPAARAQNRRVEIALADTSIKYIGEAAPSQGR
jgi:outer membrane protein OmpA-like peptidoglycan-associated protein